MCSHSGTGFCARQRSELPAAATASDPSTAAAYWDLRAERCAAERSRTYTIDVHGTEMPTMSNPTGEMAGGDATLTITVPQDQGKHTGQQ
jgi:hypothetical protein